MGASGSLFRARPLQQTVRLVVSGLDQVSRHLTRVSCLAAANTLY
jgi:hypothetical protein